MTVADDPFTWGPPDILRTGEVQAGLSARDVLDRHAALRGDQPFLIFPETGRSLTYGEARQAAARHAALLARAGVTPGDTVAFMGANGQGCVLSLLGCLYGGIRWLPVNLVSGADPISYVLDHSGARLLLLDPEQADLWQDVRAAGGPDLPVIDSPRDTGPDTTALGPVDPADVPAPAPGDDGLLMYTSGTTGRPKGVRLSHANLLAGGDNTRIAHQLSPADRGLCVLPLYHINAYCVSIMSTLLAGASVVLPHRFSVNRFWALVTETACTWASLVPTLISYLLREPERGTTGDGLRFIRSASAPLAPETHEQFEAAFGVPLIETMGLTETAAQVLSNPLPPGRRKIGSPGLAFGNRARVQAEAGHVCGPDETGEIQISGANVLREYLKNPEATRDAFTADGWFRTGDQGRMDADGYVYVTGRLKELIIKGGENISPREIDDVLYAYPDVVEAAAFAVPDADYGQTVEACLVLNGGAAGDAASAAESVLAFCRGKLGPFKTPDRVHFLEALPKGPSGKIQRLKLASLIYPDG